MADGHGEIALEVQQECRGTHLAAGGSCGACAGEEDPNPAVEIAALHAITGLADTAVAWLRRANMPGWKDYRLLARDPLLRCIEVRRAVPSRHHRDGLCRRRYAPPHREQRAVRLELKPLR